jgi:hypothetical protein
MEIVDKFCALQVGRIKKIVPIYSLKTDGGAEVKFHSFLTSVLDGGEL